MSLALRVWLVAVGIACVGCEHVEVKPVEAETPLRAKDLYPLHVGNQWTYEVRAAGQKVLRTIEILSQQDGFFLDSMNGRLAEDAKGLRDGDRYLIENPVQRGHTWFSVMTIQNTEHFEILSAGHPCTVQAGTFGRCATVRATSQIDPARTIAIESTYAEGVGLVLLRTEQIDHGRGTQQLDMELVNYKLAP
jgi:hypothetical protein